MNQADYIKETNYLQVKIAYFKGKLYEYEELATKQAAIIATSRVVSIKFCNRPGIDQKSIYLNIEDKEEFEQLTLSAFTAYAKKKLAYFEDRLSNHLNTNPDAN